jgi:hypothetical protein
LGPSWVLDEQRIDKEVGMGRLMRALAVLVIVGLALVAATNVSAQGPPIVNETMHFANEPDVFVDVNPCDPSQEVEVTSSDTGVIHFSVFADGTVHMTGTVRSDVSIDFLPTDGIADGTGSTVVWFGANGKLDPDTGEPFGKAVSTFTFSGRVTFTDGTRISFHQVAHVLFDATGVEKISFDKLKAQCG